MQSNRWAFGMIAVIGALAAYLVLVRSPLQDGNAELAALIQAEADLKSRLEIRISQAAAEAQGARLDQRYLWTSPDDMAVELSFQAGVVDRARDAGMTLRSVSAERARTLGRYQKFSVSLEATTRLEEMTDLLSQLQTAEPALRIDSMDIRAIAGRRPEVPGTPIDLRLVAWGLSEPEVAE